MKQILSPACARWVEQVENAIGFLVDHYDLDHVPQYVTKTFAPLLDVMAAGKDRRIAEECRVLSGDGAALVTARLKELQGIIYPDEQVKARLAAAPTAEEKRRLVAEEKQNLRRRREAKDRKRTPSLFDLAESAA